MNITINVPDEIGQAISQLPNRDNLNMQDLREILDEYEQSLKKTSTTNKWQEMSNRVKKNPPLSGLGEQVLRDSEEFRRNFFFNSEK